MRGGIAGDFPGLSFKHRTDNFPVKADECPTSNSIVPIANNR